MEIIIVALLLLKWQSRLLFFNLSQAFSYTDINTAASQAQ